MYIFLRLFTFKSNPKIVRQSFTIHSIKNQNYTSLQTENPKRIIYENALTNNLLIMMSELNLNSRTKIIYNYFRLVIFSAFLGVFF